MSWTRKTVSDIYDLAAKVSAFLIKTEEAAPATPGGGNVGDGTVFGPSANTIAVSETWTLTCTTGGASAVFSVVGSVTGALASANLNVPYVNDYICFTIVNGATNFSVSDVFTIVISTITANWSESRAIAGAGATMPEYIWKGIGGGSDEIYTGILGTSDLSTYFNYYIAGFSGYVSGNLFDAQPGYSGDVFGVATNTSFTCYIFENTRRVIIAPVIGTVYQQFYLGWLAPFATTSQDDYPMAIGGTSTTASRLVTDTSNYYAFWERDTSGTGYVKYFAETVIDLSENVWPYSAFSNFFNQYSPDNDSNIHIVPVTALSRSNSVVYGEFDGMYAMCAADTGLSILDTLITDQGEALFVSQNVNRIDNEDLVGIKLE